jgi:hypothetical protein
MVERVHTMTDLTKIEKPFGLLDKETRAALREYDGALEVFGGARWTSVDCVSFFPRYTYRAPPRKLPEWPVGLRPEWQWIAMDEDGQVYAYKEEPERLWSVWEKDKKGIRIDQLVDISFDGIPWRESIIKRPEGV